MKIRTDYVSNSSSTSFVLSFVLIGDVFDENDFRTSSYFKTEEKSEDMNLSIWDNKCHELGLTIIRGINDYYNQFVVGLDYEDMKADETKAAFHERVKKLLKLAFPEKTDINVGLKRDAGSDDR